MSILIKGMDMPKCCIKCPLLFDETFYCMTVGRSIPTQSIQNNKRADWCPLIEVPTPHGRLMDRDAFEKDIALNVYANKRKTMSYPTVVSNTILKTPTIIDAEE